MEPFQVLGKGVFLVLNLSVFWSQLSSGFTWWASWPWILHDSTWHQDRYFMICIPSYWLWATKAAQHHPKCEQPNGDPKMGCVRTFVCQVDAFLKFTVGNKGLKQFFCQLISKGASIFGGCPLLTTTCACLSFCPRPCPIKRYPNEGWEVSGDWR